MKSARSAAAVAELAAAHARLLRRLEEIRRIDFFDAERRAAAEEAVAAIETRGAERPEGGNPDAESKARVCGERPGSRARA